LERVVLTIKGFARLRVMQKRTKTIAITAAAGLIWLASVAYGVCFMVNYERAPGATGAVPVAWPADSKIERATDRSTLLLFAHPRCPCTRATMGELAQLLAHTQGKLRAYVIFFQPPNAGVEWTDTDLRESAKAIPGVTVLTDRSAAEAQRFGAETSGHTLLFGADGKLLFNGGITASRGHAGENAGESAIASIVNGHGAPQERTQVFGCSFASHSENAQPSTR
jgi:hypothetical protein